MSPALHATLVGSAALIAIGVAGLILSRYPHSVASRVHAAYGATVAWWLLSMSMVASAESPGRAYVWSRIAQAAVGLLPAVVYHLNLATSGLAQGRRSRIRGHYALSAAIVAILVLHPDAVLAPRLHAWGYYPVYSTWGLLPAGFLLVAFAESSLAYRHVISELTPGSLEHLRASALYYGNYLSFLAFVDFLPAFGVSFYPFGFALIAAMLTATAFGAIRHQLIEVTPAIAAEQILATIPSGVLVVDMQNVVRLANPPALRLLAGGGRDILDRPLTEVIPDGPLADAFRLRHRDAPATEVTFTGPSGCDQVVAVVGAPVHDRLESVLARVWLLRDLTDQRQSEREAARMAGRLREAQKMELLGAVAGGVAHDFNNILMVIQGGAELAASNAAAGLPVTTELRLIETAVANAANLTGQLLTYAGKGTSEQAPVDINAVTRAMGELLQAVISKKATLDVQLNEGLPQILADSSQIRQVILNLVTNASEALGTGAGRIVLRTAVSEPEHERVPRFVRLEVSDTGEGMGPDVRARIFDPFFTTKFAGRGMGLATVLGIVQKHGGVIDVDSAPGAGTRFALTFPALDSAAGPAPAASQDEGLWTGRGLTLVADDEPAVRQVVRQMLTRLGFDVIEAEDGAEAVVRFRQRLADIRLVVLDLTMPVMDGEQALVQIRAISPDMPVVVMSGYSSMAGAHIVRTGRTTFLHKPFTASALSARLREVAGGGAASEPGD